MSISVPAGRLQACNDIKCLKRKDVLDASFAAVAVAAAADDDDEDDDDDDEEEEEEEEEDIG